MSKLPDREHGVEYVIQERSDGRWQVVRLGDEQVVCRGERYDCATWIDDRGLRRVTAWARAVAPVPPPEFR